MQSLGHVMFLLIGFILILANLIQTTIKIFQDHLDWRQKCGQNNSRFRSFHRISQNPCQTALGNWWHPKIKVPLGYIIWIEKSFQTWTKSFNFDDRLWRHSFFFDEYSLMNHACTRKKSKYGIFLILGSISRWFQSLKWVEDLYSSNFSCFWLSNRKRSCCCSGRVQLLRVFSESHVTAKTWMLSEISWTLGPR